MYVTGEIISIRVKLSCIPDWKNVVAKKYKPWTMRFQGFMGIRSSAKQIQSSFDKSLHCHEMLVQMQITRVLCWRHTGVFFLSSKKAFRSYLMIFKCALAIWLHSLTVEISYMSSTGEVVSFATKTETIWRFLKCIVAKSFHNVDISEKSFKFAMLIKLYP